LALPGNQQLLSTEQEVINVQVKVFVFTRQVPQFQPVNTSCNHGEAFTFNKK